VRPSEELLPEIWGAFRASLLEHQSSKCAYCEQPVTTHPPPVEHYAPKSEVRKLEQPTSRAKRPYRVAHRTGYWWLAYEWSNWCVACSKCNSNKSCFFPVVEQPHPRPAPGIAYTPLLLHPYGPEDPEDHLCYDEEGNIWSSTPEGRATIATCWLDHGDLSRQRGQTASDMLQHIQSLDAPLFRLQQADGPPEQHLIQALDFTFRVLHRLGQPDRTFAGMVRYLIREHTPLVWSDLPQWRDLLLP